MKKIIISLLTIATLAASTSSFAWDRDDGGRRGWDRRGGSEHSEHRGGWERREFRGGRFVENVVRAPFVIAGAALSTAGTIVFSSAPGMRYDRPYDDDYRPYYQQPIYRQERIIPQQYGYRPYY